MSAENNYRRVNMEAELIAANNRLPKQATLYMREDSDTKPSRAQLVQEQQTAEAIGMFLQQPIFRGGAVTNVEYNLEEGAVNIEMMNNRPLASLPAIADIKDIL